MWRLSRRLSGKEPARQCRSHGFSPWVGKVPWEKKGQPTPVFLLGWSHGQRSLAGYSLWGSMQRVRHDWLHTHACTTTCISYVCLCAKSLQLCLTLCDPMDCSLPGSSVHVMSKKKKKKNIRVSYLFIYIPMPSFMRISNKCTYIPSLLSLSPTYSILITPDLWKK